MSLIDTFLEQMEAATFAFAMDGQVDMMSLNPLEHTNFEMMGSVFGIAGVLLTFVMGRIAKRKHLATVYESGESEEDVVEQYP